MFEVLQSEPADADGVLAAAEANQRAINLAQAEQLRLAADWADMHAVLPAGHKPFRGSERLVDSAAWAPRSWRNLRRPSWGQSSASHR